ncbi:hypothetical protein OB919_17320 [Halobacteria archaeon AArc-curdl1]|uniref:Uncharacterized protein n=1 Tax=Natronosalvus hydrolyticus TaxID=2979988 RepID=A0AAP2ZAJ7_9EURY|nr:hypothetical protein [Halobacteria archaeon AArc-curdl1]
MAIDSRARASNRRLEECALVRSVWGHSKGASDGWVVGERCV